MAQHDVQRLGFWSAVLTVIWVSLFALFLVLGIAGIDAKQGSFFVCLLLAPSFVVMMTAIHHTAPAEKKIWGQLGVTFAVIYAMLIVLVYYVQLAVVRTGGNTAALHPFTMVPGTVWFALDMLGYSFMCLATWFAAPAFTGQDRLSRWIRGFMIGHGILVLPTLVVPALMKDNPGKPHDLVGNLALLSWCIIFIPLASLVARYFAHLGRSAQE